MWAPSCVKKELEVSTKSGGSQLSYSSSGVSVYMYTKTKF